MNNSTEFKPAMPGRALRSSEPPSDKHVVQVFYDSRCLLGGKQGGYRARLKNRIVVHDVGATAKDAFDNLRQTAKTFGYPVLANEYLIELI